MKADAFLYQVIRSVSSLMAASDIYTVHHQSNVSVIARLIAQEMNLNAFEVEGIRVAGQLHDIGKYAVPNELLSKCGALYKEELSLIKMHAERGGDLLLEIDFPWPVRDMVLQHHERMDGSGYPSRLKGDQICLGARILAVADVTDAVLNARPYRKALGLDAVLTELTNNAHRYDPEVCKAFLAIVSDGGARLSGAIEITL